MLEEQNSTVSPLHIRLNHGLLFIYGLFSNYYPHKFSSCFQSRCTSAFYWKFLCSELKVNSNLFWPRKWAIFKMILSPVFTEIHQGLRGAGLRVQPRQPLRKRLLRPALLRPQPSDSEYRRSTAPRPLSRAEFLHLFFPLNPHIHIEGCVTKKNPCAQRWF